MSAEFSTPLPSTAPAPSQGQGDVKIFLGIVSFFAFAAAGFVAWMILGRAPAPGVAPEAKRRLADFMLTERSGRTVTRSELAGKFLVVNFVHTSCSISCFAINQRMAKLQEQLAGHDDVRLVSISVDPVADTPPVLTKFASQFGATTNRWLFLTGEPHVVDALLEASFIHRAPDAPRTAFFIATDRIMLVDDTGLVREQFNGLKTPPEAVLEALARLRSQSRP